MLRRHLLTASLPLALTACGLVTTGKSGTTTTVTVNLKKLVAWAEAVSANVNLILALPGAAAALGPNVTAVNMAIGMIGADITALRAAAGDAAVLTFDAGSVPEALDSLLSDFEMIVSAIGASATLPQQAGQYVAAIKAIVADMRVLMAG